MPEKIQSYKVICRGGLNTNQNYLELSEMAPGFATRLVNFESSPTGGYRRIDGFSTYGNEVTHATATAEGEILGVFIYKTPAGSYDTYACRKETTGNTYKFYKKGGSDWLPVTTGITHSYASGMRVRAATLNFGDTNVLIFVDGVNKALTFDGTTWAELSSANTGGSGSPGGNQILDKPSLVSVFKNHVFLSGDPDHPAIVCHSAPSNHLNWTSANGAGQLIAGFEVQQIKPFRDNLFIFGWSNIKKAVPDTSAGFVIEDVTSNLGCIAKDSVFELAGNLVFLSNNGLRVVAGTSRIGDVELGTISQNIHDTFIQLNETHRLNTTLNSVVIRTKNQFRFFFDDDSVAVTDSTGLIGNLVVRNGEAFWEFGELMGIRASCCWSDYVDDVEIILHGDYDGRVYRQEQGSSFNGKDIFSVYDTPYLDFGDTEIRKTFRTLNTFIKTDSSANFAVSVAYNWADPLAVNPSDYNESISQDYPVYDASFTYDSGITYPDNTSQPIFRRNIQGSGYSGKFSFASTGIIDSFTIQGFVIEFTPNGRV